MELHILREPSSKISTIGELTINGRHECWTLEDVERNVKVWGQTAMPCGRFAIVLSLSPHFKCVLPELLNVPNFDKCRIHWGNKAEDTDGCVLVGRTKAADFIGESRLAFNQLFPKIQASINAGEEVWITIEDKAAEPLKEKAVAA